MTQEVDRGSSGCTYNNGEDAFSAKTFVKFDISDPSDFDHIATNMGALGQVVDIPNLGRRAEYLRSNGGAEPSGYLLVDVDGKNGFGVQIAPSGDRADEIAVAKLLVPRVQQS